MTVINIFASTPLERVLANEKSQRPDEPDLLNKNIAEHVWDLPIIGSELLFENGDNYQSLSLYLSSIVNGYVSPSIATIDQLIDEIEHCDLLTFTWSSPQEILFTLMIVWRLKHRTRSVRTLLRGRYTSFGQDCSNQLRLFERHPLLPLLFDAILCDSDTEAYKNSILYFNNGCQGILKNVLLSDGEQFTWRTKPVTLPAEKRPEHHYKPRVGNSIMMSKQVISWQAADPTDFARGLNVLSNLPEQYKDFTVITAKNYPWRQTSAEHDISRRTMGLSFLYRKFMFCAFNPPLVDLPDWPPFQRTKDKGLI